MSYIPGPRPLVFVKTLITESVLVVRLFLSVPTGKADPCEQALCSSGAQGRTGGGDGLQAILCMTLDSTAMETAAVSCGCQFTHPGVTWGEGPSIKKPASFKLAHDHVCEAFSFSLFFFVFSR